MSGRYELTTISDIWQKVPLDKIELCCAELAQALIAMKLGLDAMNAAAPGSASIRKTWTWVDDDKSEVRMGLAIMDQGKVIAREHVATVKIG